MYIMIPCYIKTIGFAFCAVSVEKKNPLNSFVRHASRQIKNPTSRRQQVEGSKIFKVYLRGTES